VVTPNKRLGAGPLADYMAVKQACRQSGGQFYYEVGSPDKQCGTDDHNFLALA